MDVRTKKERREEEKRRVRHCPPPPVNDVPRKGARAAAGVGSGAAEPEYADEYDPPASVLSSARTSHDYYRPYSYSCVRFTRRCPRSSSARRPLRRRAASDDARPPPRRSRGRPTLVMTVPSSPSFPYLLYLRFPEEGLLDRPLPRRRRCRRRRNGPLSRSSSRRY